MVVVVLGGPAAEGLHVSGSCALGPGPEAREGDGVEQRIHADNVTDNAAYVEGTVGTQFDDMSIDASRALGTYTTLAVPQRHTPPNVAVVLPSKGEESCRD